MKWIFQKKNHFMLYFSVNQVFCIFVIKPGWISIISCNYLTGNICWEYVFDSFIKKRDFFINKKVFKCNFPRKICNCLFYNIRVRILVIPDFPFIWWSLVNLKFEFCVNYLMIDDGNLDIMSGGRLTPLLDLVEDRIISHYKRKSYQFYA